jgi:hypothetical protein
MPHVFPKKTAKSADAKHEKLLIVQWHPCIDFFTSCVPTRTRTRTRAPAHPHPSTQPPAPSTRHFFTVSAPLTGMPQTVPE